MREPAPRGMDRFDAALLREMLRDRVLLWGGGDPRIGSAALAERLGVDRTTVWARLRSWKDEGFLVRQEVVPNPSLFGAGLAAGDIRIDDPRAKRRALDAIALVDGVLAGIDQVGPYVILLYAHENEAALGRCTRLVAELAGVDDVSMCIPFAPPRSSLQPAAADWRILAALREMPDRPLRDVAARAGISNRTLTRRYARLLEGNAIWSFPVLDFQRYQDAVMARFVVGLSDRAVAPALRNACRRSLPGMVWWDAPAEQLLRLDDATAWVDVYCHLATAAEAESVQQWLLDTPGVEGVEIFFPKTWFVVPTWWDERIATRIAAHAPG